MEDKVNLDKKWIVYCHTNMINNKRYIGITSRETSVRWGKDGSGYSTHKHFYSAIQKYGWDNFEHTILFEGLDEEMAIDVEAALIFNLKTYLKEYGYNKSVSGNFCFDRDHEVWILSVAREKKFIEKYDSVKDCVSKNNCSGTLKNVIEKRKKIAIKFKYIKQYLNIDLFKDKKSIILKFDVYGDLIEDENKWKICQVVELYTPHNKSVKIRGLGFQKFGSNNINTTFKYIEKEFDELLLMKKNKQNRMKGMNSLEI